MHRRPRLFLLLNRAHRAVRTRVERETGAVVGLTMLELASIWALLSKPESGVQELARALFVDHAVVSRLSEQLVRKGIVTRSRDPGDRRKTRLALTPLGLQKAQRGRSLLSSANARIGEGFTDEELATVARFLTHLVRVAADPTPLEAP